MLLYRNQPDGWVAEVPAIPGCYALMPTREEALAELARVFEMTAAEYGEKSQSRHHGNRACLAPVPMNFGARHRVWDCEGCRRAVSSRPISLGVCGVSKTQPLPLVAARLSAAWLSRHFTLIS